MLTCHVNNLAAYRKKHNLFVKVPILFVCVITKDGEVTFWLRRFVVSGHYLPGAIMASQEQTPENLR